MAIYFLSSQPLILLLLLSFSSTHLTVQSTSNNTSTGFSCSVDSPPSWEAYVAYFAQPPAFLDLGNISDLFQVSRVSVAESSNLASENIQLFQDQLLFCQHYLSVKVGDTFSDVSTNSYENLTNYHVIEEFNPDHSPTLLPVGIKVTLPLFCSCPSKACTLNGTKYFITYVWQLGDDVTQVVPSLKHLRWKLAMKTRILQWGFQF